MMSLYHNENVKIQWCMITEACEKAGEGHRFGGIWGNPYGTYHHNLIAHNDSRNPRWASGCGYNDYRNNVLYNWGYNSCYGAEKVQQGSDVFVFSTVNMIANYYKPGPATATSVRGRIAEPSTRNGEADAGKWWVSGNVIEGVPSGRKPISGSASPGMPCRSMSSPLRMLISWSWPIRVVPGPTGIR